MSCQYCEGGTPGRALGLMSSVRALLLQGPYVRGLCLEHSVQLERFAATRGLPLPPEPEPEPEP